MLNKALFKRIVPFILTFAAGLFIASFFVNVIPSFKVKKNNRCGKRQEVRILKYERERLQLENQRLKQRLEETERMMLLEEPVPPPPPLAPLAPGRVN